MGTIFAKELRRTRFSLIIWSAIAGLVIFFGILEYPALMQITGSMGMGAMEAAIAAIPAPGQLVFGIYDVNLNDPIGYYIVMYYWTGLIVFTHAMFTGASIISKESRDKTAEFLFTKPYKRGVIVWAKVFTAFVNILVVGIAALTLSILGMIPVTHDTAVYAHIIETGAGMLFTQCVLMTLGLLCSAIFKTYRSGVFAAMALLIICYCLMFIVQFRGSLYFLSPLAYFEISYVAANGLNAWYILLSAAVITVCLCLAQIFYKRKVMI